VIVAQTYDCGSDLLALIYRIDGFDFNLYGSATEFLSLTLPNLVKMESAFTVPAAPLLSNAPVGMVTEKEHTAPSPIRNW
jgi:hypothetical protein